MRNSDSSTQSDLKYHNRYIISIKKLKPDILKEGYNIAVINLLVIYILPINIILKLRFDGKKELSNIIFTILTLTIYALNLG